MQFNLISEAYKQGFNVTVSPNDDPAYRVRTKIYPLTGIVEHTVYETPMFLPNKPSRPHRAKPSGSSEPDFRKRNKRAEAMIYDYVLGTPFDFWTTLTFDEKKHPWCFDFDEVVKRVPKWFDNFKQRYSPNLYYLMVFEVRESGAWHVHLFMGGVESRYVIRTKHINKYNRTWHDFLPWSEKFGFTSLDPISELYKKDRQGLMKVASYLSKYMTKTEAKEINKKRYRVSKKLSPAPLRSYSLESQPLGTLKTDTALSYHGWKYVRNDEGAIYNVAHKFIEK
jgi:hypothetical protein